MIAKQVKRTGYGASRLNKSVHFLYMCEEDKMEMGRLSISD